MNRLHRFMVCTAIAGPAVLLIGAGCYAAGARVNTSKSIPVGLYWTSSAPVEKGAYVLLCPPENGVFAEAMRRGYLTAGFCPGGYGYMMKRILAAVDDKVSIAADGVRVNEQLLPLSVPLTKDLLGRGLPRYRAAKIVLGDSQVLLMSDVSGTSFDARYFGPVDRAQIRSVLTPVWTW
jgi:conjugative transfer signal peptidase TraF